jgi:hypothetical protein
MTEYEVFGYLSGRRQPLDDEEVVPDAGEMDLDEEAVDSYLDVLRRSRPRARYRFSEK